MSVACSIPLSITSSPPAWLNKLDDPMDDEGFVHVSQDPGLGQDINFDYIRDNRIDAY